MRRFVTAAAIVVAAFLYGCGGHGAGRGADGGEADAGAKSRNRVFQPAPAPSMLDPEQQAAYLNEHYWDNFDFADTLFISEADTLQMITALAAYTQQFVPDSLAVESMSRLMNKASVSKPMLEYFLMLTESVLHDPNSPLRDDELYIPVLETALGSGLLDEYERMPYEYDLNMARQNRVGRKANDFRYTLASDRSGRMYDIRADYLLLFISNPGCPMCRDVRSQIKASPMLNELIERGTLKVLVIYPDMDLTLWREHLDDYPPAWINAYDYGGAITKERLYDLRAIPSLYLLDAEKRVMVKDCVDVAYIEEVISSAETK